MKGYFYKILPISLTLHRFSVTSVALGFRLFLIQLQINLLSGWMSSKRGKGSVGGGEAGKKAKTTPDAGGKSVIE